ncbi:hypothetical protein A1O1_06629 [Capronia coronata CBS 617.96]|uniref:Uncharacterized protein n=1 Tax=Capronia coronata CBS 617.96 TaxID=1182541 RepID=W9YVF0_9EURO|nr:uncharacterized protein A1O1_06629 [Capronia coronata CBS 617.96]EXJ86259.1 hypothetical protein A1O1_06629 [Capronia coronata CBS 617.96]
MSRFGYSTPIPTPTDSWSSYFDSWKTEDREIPVWEPLILDQYDELHPQTLQVKFNADLNFDLDWGMDYLQDGCSPLPLPPSLATGKLNDAHQAHPRQGPLQGQNNNIDCRSRACRVSCRSDDVDMGFERVMAIDGDGNGMPVRTWTKLRHQRQAPRQQPLEQPTKTRTQFMGASTGIGTTGTATSTAPSNFSSPTAATNLKTRSLRRTQATRAPRATRRLPSPSSQPLIGDLAWPHTLDLTTTGTDLPANHDTVSAALP